MLAKSVEVWSTHVRPEDQTRTVWVVDGYTSARERRLPILARLRGVDEASALIAGRTPMMRVVLRVPPRRHTRRRAHTRTRINAWVSTGQHP